LKVLQINSVCGFGSTGRIATDIADILIERGDDCKILFGRGTAPEKYKDIAVCISSSLEVKLHGIITRLFDKHGFCSKAATRRLIREIENYSPDIIHLHNVHGYYLNIELLFAYLKQADIPVVWTLHDCWTMTGHCAHFSAVGCTKYLSECTACPQLGEYPATLYGGNVKSNFLRKKAAFTGVRNLTIITPSKWLAEVTKASFLGEYPVIPIYNGLDLDVFKPTTSSFKKQHGIEDKKMVLGAANVWDKYKGLNDFIELAGKLDNSYKLVLVGLSAEQIAALPQNIIGLPRTKTINELAELYSAADVFVNPSIQETMGLTTAEALACGTPVITYNKTAVPEVPDSSCGIVIEPGVDNIIAALDNVNFSAEACIDRAKHFEKKKQYLKYIDVYKKGLR